MAWSLHDTADRLRDEEELAAGVREDDRFYELVLRLTNSIDEAERYLYERIQARTKAAVMQRLHD